MTCQNSKIEHEIGFEHQTLDEKRTESKTDTDRDKFSVYLHIYVHMFNGKYCLYQLQNTQSIIHPDSYQSFPFSSSFGTGEQKRNGSLK